LKRLEPRNPLRAVERGVKKAGPVGVAACVAVKDYGPASCERDEMLDIVVLERRTSTQRR
jgi:hypothetical protein